MSCPLQEEKDSFIISWRVKNFSMAAAESGEYIVSPNIVISKFGNSEWNLHLYPKGDDNSGFIACYLTCHTMGSENIDKIEFHIALVPKPLKFKPHLMDFELKTSYGNNRLITFENIFSEKEKYLPNDTLTIECFVRCVYEGNDNDIEKEMLEKLARKYLTGNLTCNLSKCCFESTIHVYYKKAVWPVHNFLSISSRKRVPLPVFSAVKGIPSFYVMLYKIENCVQIEIIMKENTCFKEVFVRCNISVVNTKSGEDIKREDDFMFNSSYNQVWKFPIFFDYKTLEETKYFEHTQGVLYLQLDFALAVRGKMHHIEKDNGNPLLVPPKIQVPVEVLNSSTVEEKLAVVTLRAGDQSFKVHRSILEARSEVFSAMFENEMMEKHTGVVEISDVEPDILGQMVAFFYSGTTKNMSITEVEKLYSVADKYQVVSLVEHCSSILMSSLTESNVCRILSLADLYRDKRLLKCAEQFVVDNFEAERILVSQDWKNLMVQNPSVAANVMYKMLVK